MTRLITFALVALTCLSTAARAQDEEESGGFLVDLLQDNLSGDNRYIKVTGLDGAFSSQASIEKLTVADDDGIWLTVTNAVLDWNRLALIRGRFSVNKLSADEIIVARKPKPVETADDLPPPEAKPFQVPELPVALEIGEISVNRIELGEPLMGMAAELAVSGALSLADGSLDTTLAVTRLDRPTDQLDLTTGFQNETSQITVDLTLAEDAGGLLSELLSVPDRPSILLTAKGSGPVSDFTADIALASNGTERLSGLVELKAVSEDAAQGEAGIGFDVNIAGDVTPLIAGEYKEFFGADTQLVLSGRTGESGGVSVETFNMLSAALMLNGGLDIAADGLLDRVSLEGRISPPNGDEVVLPMGEPRTAIAQAVISAGFQAGDDDGWRLVLGIDGLNRPDLTATRAQINATGTLEQNGGMTLDGTLNAVIRGLAFTDPALDQAVGPEIVLNGGFERQSNSALTLRDIVLTGSDYSATVNAEIDGLESGFNVDGSAEVTASDLSRFSAISGQDLGGSVTATVTGSGAPLSGMFAFDLKMTAQDLESGIAQVDPLITGETTLALAAERDEDGLDIQRFRLDGTALSAEATGSAQSGFTTLEFSAALDDLARVVPDVSGPVTISGDMTRSADEITGQVRVKGPQESFANLDGSIATEGDADVSFDAVLGQVEKFVPQLSGDITAQGRATRRDDVWQVDADVQEEGGSVFDLSGSMKADGSIDGRYDATIARIERFVPQLNGAIEAEGTARRLDNAWKVASDIRGPSGSQVDIDGSMAADGTIRATYDATIAAVERFVPQLSGEITAKGTAARIDNAWEVATDVREPAGSLARLQGTMAADGTIRATYDATVAAMERFVPQLEGALTAKGTASRIDNAWDVEADVNGPTGSTARLDGSMAADGTIDATYDATITRIERFVPELAGSVSAKGTAQRVEDTWKVASDVKGPSGSTIALAGSMTPDGDIDATYDASLRRIERFVPEFPGTVTAKGTAKRKDTLWTVATDATGPGNLSIDLDGTVDQDSLIADLTAKGQVQLAAANRFIKPNSVRGTAAFDLALKGKASPESLSGRITTNNTTVAIPAVRQAIDDLDAEITLAGGRANLSVSAVLRAGGRVVVSGPVSMKPPFDASIVAELQQLILTDNVTFDSSANGRLAYTGALAGRGQLSGDIRFGETNININALSGTASAAPIPDIIHVGEPGPQRATRDYAGLIKSANGGGAAPDIGLDIHLIAENKVFVRGRGLTAELGGDILVRGSVARVSPSGQIDLIRGTLSLMGRRLELTKGLVTLQGNLSPYMEFAASTSTSDGDASLEISGPITKPTVKVDSDPERPSEEALAMLLFGNQYSELSPIKIAQIAASLATLSGSGGGASEKARNELGVDTVDIGTDDSGKAQFGAGKYIADGVYTDVTVNAEGDTEVNLNLDITDNLTVKGSVDREGETGIGLFFERDY